MNRKRVNGANRFKNLYWHRIDWTKVTEPKPNCHLHVDVTLPTSSGATESFDCFELKSMVTDNKRPDGTEGVTMQRVRRSLRGIWYLFLVGMMSPNTFAQELLWRAFGGGAGEYFSSSISFGGDSDGDGLADAIVGAPDVSCNGAYSGQASALRGIDGTSVQVACGAPLSELGRVIAGDIDVNQDGIADFAAGSFSDGRGGTLAGSFTIYSGADGSVLRDVLGAPAQELGYAMTSIEDIDGDGARDFVVSSAGSYFVTVYSAVSGATLMTLLPPPGSKAFGTSLAEAGDVNGDGITDLLVGDYVGDGVNSRTGRVWVYSGADGSILYSLEGEQADAYFGWAVDGIGDVDLDGYSDFIVGAPDFQVNLVYQGKIYAYSGKSGALLYSYIGQGDLGQGVGRVGDVNNDGYVDFVAGDSFDRSEPNVEGVVHMYSGRNGLQLYHWTAKPTTAGFGTGFGAQVAGVENIDGHRRAGVMIAAANDESYGKNAGAVAVYALEQFYCDATPKIQHVRGTIDVQMSQTNPGNLVGLALVAIDGTPTFSFLAISTADSLGRLVVSDKVPSGWANHNIDLQSFAIGYTGKVVASNSEHVEFIR